MSERDSGASLRPRRGRWLVFFVGMLVGAVVAALLPRYMTPYLEGILGGPSNVVEGRVVEKDPQEDRVVLRVSTPDGVLLASFTENHADVDLLVELGSSIRLGVRRYQPFLDNPVILAVREPTNSPRGDTGDSAREVYEKRMETQLRTWDQRLRELEVAAAEASDDVAKEYEAELQELRAKRDATRQKLSELSSTGGAAWTDLKGGLDAAWAELDAALSKAAARFHEEEKSSED